ncbi:uncharacterized protein BT62DRAFT_119239 [Guyanagaster necrorhizus]|uniref:Uncharacterized protein n=1 Tax=Guyanagaster necrorhizus TaxID=856835 RepID=A0A9P7VU24_9AGAR|nr:uncharacterized protein BT62DRAFT_119239 [Guyanagaster necrorhizus MCA 3950]KAG7446460.1 hypothetical protein BT62DRAFT_119239 [Guyanagaster necrorhizus MCA 3950]
MSYAYYHQAPGWGSNQFHFGAPPAPTFQPQPSWGGIDYYRAHALSPQADPLLFDNAWNRVRDFGPNSGGLGVGINEARHWHSRAYGGLGELNQMLPQEVGHAAAYEAYRTWIHNSSIYEPLSGDFERQREALIGLAVAESSRLLGYTARSMDNYARSAAAEAAAMTASIIFYWSRDHDDDYRGRGTQGDPYDDRYEYDSDVLHGHRRGRSHSRHRSLSVSSYNMPYSGGGIAPAPSTMPMPIPGMASSIGYPGQPGSYGQPGNYGSYPGQPGSYPGQYAGSQYGGGMPMSMHGGGTAYAGSDPGGPINSGGYAAPMVMHSRPRSVSMSMPGHYPHTPYSAGGAMMIGGVPQAQIMPQGVPQSQVVVLKPNKKHRHHHKHHHRSRSRSSRY